VSPSRRYRVTGRVQGVGFRAFVIRVGRAAGVRGAVRNEPDGSVLVVAQGVEAAMERFRAGLTQGPPAARVLDVAEVSGPTETHAERFDASF